MIKNILKVQRVVVAAIICNKNEVLLLQRSKNEKVYPNLWELPSGKKEFSEDPLIALKREVLEEANLKVVKALPFSVFNYVIKKDTETRDTTQINFIVQVQNVDKIKLSSEHQDFKWVNKNNLSKIKASKIILEILKKVLSKNMCSFL